MRGETTDARGRSCTIHRGHRRLPDETSVYEIGSITKLFTALLLALAVQQQPHTITLDTPVVDLLLENSSARGPLPHFPREITVQRLATHTSGMPRLPQDWNFFWYLFFHQRNPYSGYHASHLATSLRKYRDWEREEIGKHFEYSNWGMGLLGYALTVAMPVRGGGWCQNDSDDTIKPVSSPAIQNSTAVAYEQILREYITDPLQLYHTTVQPTDRLLPGFNAKGRTAAHWTFDALVGCGAIHSTLQDLLHFGVVHLRAARKETPDTPMESAMQLCHKRHFLIDEADDEELSIGLGWLQETNKTLGNGKNTMFWHNGGTYGFASYLGWEAETGTVVVVLSNSKAVDAMPLGKRILLDAIEHKLIRKQALESLDKPGSEIL